MLERVEAQQRELVVARVQPARVRQEQVRQEQRQVVWR